MAREELQVMFLSVSEENSLTYRKRLVQPSDGVPRGFGARYLEKQLAET